MTTFHVRQHGADIAIAECPTMGSANELAKEKAATEGGRWLVIRTRGRLSEVVNRFEVRDILDYNALPGEDR